MGGPLFDQALQQLISGIDAAAHGAAIATLRRCRAVADLDHLVDGGGWLEPATHSRGPRLKLVRHNSGTYLVVRYEDGWSSRVSQAPFRR